MELRHLRYFLAVAQEKNFTRAASRVGIGQPPLSQQVRDLEAEVGVPLFRRLSHGAELTAAGQAFLDSVAHIPGEIADAVRKAQRAGRGEVGALRVGFTGSAAMNPLIPGSIRAYRRSHPEVELTLAESNTTSLIGGLRDGGIDLAFIRPLPDEASDMHVIPLPDERMIVALPTNHRALPPDDGPIALASLKDDVFVLTPRAIGPHLFDTAMQACEAAGFMAKLGQAAPQISSVLSLVATAEGVSIVPESMRQLSLEGVAYREMADPQATVRLSLAYMRSSRSETVRRFLAVVRKETNPSLRSA